MLPEENWATSIDDMHRKFGEDRICSFVDRFVDRHTNKKTMLIVTFCSPAKGRVIILFFEITVELLF